MLQDTVVIEGEVSLVSQIDGDPSLLSAVDGDPDVVIAEGMSPTYPHYSGSYTVTPSTSAQVLDTSDKVMDDDVTVQAVPQGSATTPATIITANPTLSRSGRVVTATVSKTQQVTPTVVEGYVSSGTAGNIGVSGSETLTIPEGSATTPATSVTANPSISVSSAGVITATVSKSESVTPTVVEGYVSSGTAGTVSVSGSATENLTTQGATTYHVSSSDQTIASGKYLTGTQTIQKVVVDGLTADKIVDGHTVKIGDVDDDDRIMSVTGTASGGGTEEAYPNDVVLVDYDGTVVYSYSAEEFATLSALPANPSHSGLTAQGWNWTLANAKAYVAKYRILNIGAHYVTTDDKTHIVVSFDPYMPSAWLAFGLKIKTSVSGAVTINWGDGNTTTTSGTGENSYSHTYADYGKYEITLTRASGTVTLGERVTPTGGNTTQAIKEIRLGSNVILAKTCNSCFALKRISVATDTVMDSNTNFYYCYSLKQVTIPEGTSGFGSSRYNRAKYICLPKTFTTTATYFCGNGAVLRMCIPESITRIYQRFVSETNVTQIIVVPDTVTQIDAQGFFSMGGNTIYHFYPTTPPTLANSNGVGGAFKIYVPYRVDHSILNAYTTASNWSSLASNIEEEPQ